MGLQNKIFLYAGISLAALMSLLTWISVQTNRQATDMVYRERLALVQNVALGVDDIIDNSDIEMDGATLTNAQREQLNSFLRLQKGGYNLEIVDDDGVILASSITGQALANSFHWEVVRTMRQERQAGVVKHQHSREVGHLVAFAPLKELPWGVILARPEEELLTLPWMGKSPLLVIGLVLFLAAGLMWLVTRQIVTPLKRLAATAQRFGSGELEAPIPVTGRDEIGELAGSLDTMRLQLK